MGTKFTAIGSSSTAAAIARHLATSKPCQTPLASGAENPAKPVETPQFSSPRSRIACSVCACAMPATKAVAAKAPTNTDFFMSSSLLSPPSRRSAPEYPGLHDSIPFISSASANLCRFPFAGQAWKWKIAVKMPGSCAHCPEMGRIAKADRHDYVCLRGRPGGFKHASKYHALALANPASASIENIEENRGLANHPPPGGNGNPGALAGATGGSQIEKAASLEPKEYSEPAPRATLSAVTDWNRNRWAWKRAVLADRRLADRAKLLATVLVDTFAHCETGRCNPSNETLAETLGKDVRSIRRAVAELRAAGWIDTRTGRGRGARIAFVFLTGDGTVPIADTRKVAEMAAYRSEPPGERRTDVSAYQTEKRTPEPAERRTPASGKADRTVRVLHRTKEKPNTRAPARPAGADHSQARRPANARPVPFSRVVHRGSSAEADWNRFAAEHNQPSLPEVGLRASDAEGPGWDMPWIFPPPAHDPERVEQAVSFFWWLVNQRNDRARASAPPHAMAAGG
ncbi:MAG: helix-turn-helix domain-containing protein [Rhodobacteraceae bacterium]|nr:MAG: helix-turn-helix domain-containing protein [Paracoccaceae bacterium]